MMPSYSILTTKWRRRRVAYQRRRAYIKFTLELLLNLQFTLQINWVMIFFFTIWRWPIDWIPTLVRGVNKLIENCTFSYLRLIKHLSNIIKVWPYMTIVKSGSNIKVAPADFPMWPELDTNNSSWWLMKKIIKWH